MTNRWVAIGAVSAFLGVALGAFGAHALRDRLDERAMSVYHTASQYQMYHALALIAFGLWSTRSAESVSSFAGWAFLAGTVIFSGSLYALAISGIKILGAITPIGGLCLMAGWLAFAYSAVRSP